MNRVSVIRMGEKYFVVSHDESAEFLRNPIFTLKKQEKEGIRKFKRRIKRELRDFGIKSVIGLDSIN